MLGARNRGVASAYSGKPGKAPEGALTMSIKQTFDLVT